MTIKSQDGAAESADVGELWLADKTVMIAKRAEIDALLTYRLWTKADGVYFITKGKW